MKTIKIFTVLCATAILLATNVYAQHARKEIILGCETSLVTAPVWIAENKGYFREEGVNVKIEEFGSGRTALAAMLNQGNLDMVTVAQTPVMFNSFNRNDFVIIAAMACSDNDVKVLVRQDKGIKNALDLKGKKVGKARMVRKCYDR